MLSVFVKPRCQEIFVSDRNARARHGVLYRPNICTKTHDEISMYVVELKICDLCDCSGCISGSSCMVIREIYVIL